MKKILQTLIPVFAILPFTVKGQLTLKNFPLQEEGKPAKYSVSAGASYNLNSTAITNSLYNKYLYSDYMDEKAKNTVLPNLNDNNRFGAYAEQFVNFSLPYKKIPNTVLNFEIKNRRHYGMVFTDDAYKLVMYGNSQFAGKEAVLDKTNLYRLNYQTVSVGFDRQLNVRDKKIEFGANIGLSHGTKITDVKINKGRVFTSLAGDSIAAVADINARYANLTGVEERTAGLGASISANFRYHLSDKNYLAFSVTDLGFINFYRAESRTYSTNQTISYRGYEANSFSQSFTPDKFDALPQKIEKEVDSAEVDETFTIWQPAQVQFFYSQNIGKKTRAILGAEYFMFSYHLPSVHLNILQEVTPWLNVLGGVNVLGYGKFGVNLGITATIHNISVTLGTEHAEAPIAPENTFGQGGYLSLRYSW